MKSLLLHLKYQRNVVSRKTVAVWTCLQVKINRKLRSYSTRENQRCEVFLKCVCLCCASRGEKKTLHLTPCQSTLRTLTAVRLMSSHGTSKHRQKSSPLWWRALWGLEERERESESAYLRYALSLSLSFSHSGSEKWCDIDEGLRFGFATSQPETKRAHLHHALAHRCMWNQSQSVTHGGDKSVKERNWELSQDDDEQVEILCCATAVGSCFRVCLFFATSRARREPKIMVSNTCDCHWLTVVKCLQ